MAGNPVAALRWQCWSFTVGSALFAVGTAPGFTATVGAAVTNALCFAGSWFFTAAAAVQLRRTAWAERAAWWSAAVQSVGTVAFNVSTGAAVWAQRVQTERQLVWAPDAAGSVAFLLSAALGVAAAAGGGRRDRWAGWVNAVGCVAFGVSAVGAYVRSSGVTEDAGAANVGTFIGAVCFAVAALTVLPKRRAR